MSGMDRKNSNGSVAGAAQSKLVLSVAAVAVALLMACNYGGDHKTPHPPVNPAMSGSPSESDHTNADVDDLKDGYGTGTAGAAVKDDNTERTKGGTVDTPAKDSTAVPVKK